MTDTETLNAVRALFARTDQDQDGDLSGSDFVEEIGLLLAEAAQGWTATEKPARVLIMLEGGLVQEVCRDGEANVEVMIVDYDAGEFGDEDDEMVTMLPQDEDGEQVAAWVSWWDRASIGQVYEPIAQALRKMFPAPNEEVAHD